MKKILIVKLMFILTIVAIICPLTSLKQSSFAAENDRHNSDRKMTKQSEKCWKRLPPLEKELISLEYSTVCKAYAEVLNKTCEPPEKLRCNWTLPTDEKRFKKLKWVQVDPRDYWALIEDLNVSGIRENLRDELWKTKEAQERKELDAGKRKLSVTTVDIDQNGNDEQLMRYDLLPCKDTPGSIFGVMDSKTKKMDWARNQVLVHVNSLSEGSEILLYEGKAFMLKVEEIYSEPESNSAKEVRIYKGFSLFGGSSFGSINICRFEYLKGRK